MSSSRNLDFASENLRPQGNIVFLSPLPTWLPGDATPYYGTHSSYDPIQESPSTPRRRSSASYPYPISPTRTRFGATASHGSQVPYYQSSIYSPAHSRDTSSVLGPDRHGRTYGRAEEVGGHGMRRLSRADPRLLPLQPATLVRPPIIGPTNHDLVPQPLFQEPISALGHTYRYDPISFRLDGFPEVGVKVGTLTMGNPPRLYGDRDLVFKSVTERELKVQIIWPGYASRPFEKRVKTLAKKLQRGTLAVQLANMVTDFAYELRHTKVPIEQGKERWAVKTEHWGGINVRDIFITRFVHCGGSHWQMELWTPKL